MNSNPKLIQEKLDVKNKSRANIFNWRGQFTPQFVDYLLDSFAKPGPEDCRLTDIDNVFLLRHAKRLPFKKRSSYEEVKIQHKDFPIDREVVHKFVEEIQVFIDAVWYDPAEALKRGSFV